MKDRPDAIQLQSGSAPLELKDGIFLSHNFSVMEIRPSRLNFWYYSSQLSHDFSAMETAAIFRPSLISKKRRFSRIMLTY